MLKIVVVGAPGVGKTTFVNALEEYLLQHGLKVDVLPEVARIVYDLGYQIDRNANLNAEFEIFANQLLGERILDESADVVILDRGVIDCLAYFTYLLDSGILSVPDELFNLIWEICYEKVQSYDIVFYLPIEMPVEDDGVRDVDERYRKNIDNYLKSVMEDLNVEYVVLEGSSNQRLQKALQSMKTVSKRQKEESEDTELLAERLLKCQKSHYKLNAIIEHWRDKIIKALKKGKKDKIKDIIDKIKEDVKQLPYNQRKMVEREMLAFLKLKNLIKTKSETEAALLTQIRRLSYRG